MDSGLINSSVESIWYQWLKEQVRKIPAQQSNCGDILAVFLDTILSS